MVVLKCLTNIIALNYIENSEAKSQIITLLESYSIPFNWSADVNPVMISGLNGTRTRPGVARRAQDSSPVHAWNFSGLSFTTA